MTEEIKKLFGPLYPLLSDEEVGEIAIDSYHEVFVNRVGYWKSEVVFTSPKQLDEIVEGIREHFGISEKEGVFSRYLTEVLSVTVIQKPIALKGASIRIMKLPKRIFGLEDYLKFGAIDKESKNKIEKILKSNEGIICGGDFGSGKTTLYNMLINSLPSDISIVSIEPQADLVFQRQRVCRLMPRGRESKDINEVIDAASKAGGDFIGLSFLDEQWTYPYLDMLRNNSNGITAATGSSPKNVLDRIVRNTVVSSYGYSLEEASLLISEVFKYIIFQEKDKDTNIRGISSICEIKNEDGVLKVVEI
ncbi:ATPase, T2SS/T4P/T4SS family [Halobacteriovorax sp.]|uniref:ATPase, T2SS/T4P/T4SS family n=1 Tax=Halobacteriovorax sp. TaxID=2020862 RepID=UPI003AF2AB1E